MSNFEKQFLRMIVDSRIRLEEWEAERDKCDECDGEGTIICATYDDPYNEEPCPECQDDGSDWKYESSVGK